MALKPFPQPAFFRAASLRKSEPQSTQSLKRLFSGFLEALATLPLVTSTASDITASTASFARWSKSRLDAIDVIAIMQFRRLSGVVTPATPLS